MSILSRQRRARRDTLLAHPAVIRQTMRQSGAVRHGKHALQRVHLTGRDIPKTLAPKGRRAA